MIIDFHAHAFPDELALKTVPLLAEKGGITATLDGTIKSLIASMQRAGISRSVLGSIATRPGQFTTIMKWVTKIRSPQIEPFPSFHPADPDMLEQIKTIHSQGFKGIKLHPYYQEFKIDEQRLFPAYELMADLGLILLMHSGFDIGFPHLRIAEPQRTANIIKRFPKLKLVAAHLGGWQLWDEVKKFLVGKNVYLDLAFSLDFLSVNEARAIITNHPPDRILFGTDTPWADQEQEIENLRKLNLENELEKNILGKNGEKLLN
jgi:predicted TIM-barrel fold metal-dependent hydrolase